MSICINGGWEELVTILPTVSVPVLSEHKTDIQPRVSIVARFFTKTLCFAMRFAMIVRDKATQTGNPLRGHEYRQFILDRWHHLRDESGQATNGVNYGDGSRLITWIFFPKPGAPH